jgi:hypothetical protein
MPPQRLRSAVAQWSSTAPTSRRHCVEIHRAVCAPVALTAASTSKARMRRLPVMRPRPPDPGVSHIARMRGARIAMCWFLHWPTSDHATALPVISPCRRDCRAPAMRCPSVRLLRRRSRRTLARRAGGFRVSYSLYSAPNTLRRRPLSHRVSATAGSSGRGELGSSACLPGSRSRQRLLRNFALQFRSYEVLLSVP